MVKALIFKKCILVCVWLSQTQQNNSSCFLSLKIWKFNKKLNSYLQIRAKCQIVISQKNAKWNMKKVRNCQTSLNVVLTMCNDQQWNSKGRAKVCNRREHRATPGQRPASFQHFIIWHIALWHFVILHFFWHIALRHFAMHLLFVYLTNVKTVPLKI